MYIHVPFHFNPIRELEWMIRALGIFKRHKIPIEEKAHALHLYTASLSSWEIADAMEDHYGRKPSHASVLDWARALGSVGWTIPPRGRRLIAVAVDEAAEKANGREVYAWAAIDVDTREPLAIKVSWSRGPVVRELHGRSPLPEPGARGLHEQTDVRLGGGPVVLVGLPGAGYGALPRGVRGQERG